MASEKSPIKFIWNPYNENRGREEEEQEDTVQVSYDWGPATHNYTSANGLTSIEFIAGSKGSELPFNGQQFKLSASGCYTKYW